jgi:phage terminase Nu1 subunit (DNA packaging protein)
MGSAPLNSEFQRESGTFLPGFNSSTFLPRASTAELSKILKISERRIRELVADGVLPRESRGSFDLTACTSAYIEFLNQPETQERRAAALGGSGSKKITSARADLIRAQAERAELRLAKERGELISVQVYQREVGGAFRAVREGFLNLPYHIAPHLVGLSEQEMFAKLTAEIREVLTRLSRGEDTDRLLTSAK